MENELEIQGLWSLNFKFMYDEIIKKCPFEIGEKKKEEILWLINNYLSHNPVEDYIILPSNNCLNVWIKAGKKFYILYFRADDIMIRFHSIKSIKEIKVDFKDNNYAEVGIYLIDSVVPRYRDEYSICNKEASKFFAKLI